MLRSLRWAWIGTCTSALLSSTSAQAGGLLAQELANPRNGTAQAGQAAYAYDAATAFYNPAGMARLEEPEAMLGLQPIWADIEFDTDSNTSFAGGDGDDQGGLAPSLGASYVHPLNERWAIGAATAGIAGGALDPDGDWAGRFFVTELSLVALAVNPVVSYRVTDRLSVGGGVALNYGRLDFKLKLPRLTPGAEGEVEMNGVDDFALSWNLGVLFEPSERTRFGIAYRSKVDFEMTGDFELENPTPVLLALGISEGDVDADVPIPQYVRASVYHQLTDSLAVLGDVGWEDWSEMDFTPITGPAGRTIEVPRGWHDTWHFGLGLEWQATPYWLFQTGVAFDTSPVRDRHHNLPDMPSDRQWRFSGGFVYDWSETTQIGVNYTYVDFGRSPIDVTNNFGRLSGDYEDFGAHVFAVSVAF
jgi:long-chain fatty acid transport protein